MRKLNPHGTCEQCGAAGPVWVNVLKVLDFGVETMPPIEPDTTAPVLCDRCEMPRSVRAAYASDPALAARIYCAPDAEAAIRLLLGE